jgi:hypothetical protein
LRSVPELLLKLISRIASAVSIAHQFDRSSVRMESLVKESYNIRDLRDLLLCGANRESDAQKNV